MSWDPQLLCLGTINDFLSCKLHQQFSTYKIRLAKFTNLKNIENCNRNIIVSCNTDIIMQGYAMDHMMQDHLIVGFASEKANPFREKTWSCELI